MTGGMCPWAKCLGSTCPGGTCPGGFCPVTCLVLPRNFLKGELDTFFYVMIQ